VYEINAPLHVTDRALFTQDRHNGNILIDTDGHVIHIDFGFILGISPGGNLGFETAAFKFSHEMLELLGGEGSEGFTALQALTVQAFLAARQIKESILALVNAFADSDLPCFQYRKDTLERLYEKFFPSLSESEAAEKMIGLVRDAMHNPTTSMYDGIQKLQNNIYSAEWK
jgi:phosphatidylinositol 4-kinase